MPVSPLQLPLRFVIPLLDCNNVSGSIMFPARPEIVVLDGGFATQLTYYVGDVIDGNPLWSTAFLAKTPREVLLTHLDFLRAGAMAIITNTYQASVGGFMEHLNLTEEDSILLIKKSVELAKEACDIYMKENGKFAGVKRPLIVGSVGPYGACQHDYSEYTGKYAEHVTKDILVEWHRPRMQALIEAGVDLLAMETIPILIEGEALVELLKEFPQQKAWLSFTCKDEFHIPNGEKFQECLRTCWELNPTQLVAVGANCLNPKYVSQLFKGINEKDIRIPLIVYPNSGEIFIPDKGWTRTSDSPPHISTFVKEWLDLGISYVGGCCRTFPDDILKIKTEVENWLQERQLCHKYT